MEEKNVAVGAPVPEQDINKIIKSAVKNLRDLQSAGKNPFEIVRFDKTSASADILKNYADFDGKTLKLAGRLISKRVMGKASFAHLLDGEGQIQLYFKRDILGDEPYADFKKYDIGDIIGITGDVFTTHMGEITVNVSEVVLLVQIPSSASRKIPRINQHGFTLPSALRLTLSSIPR